MIETALCVTFVLVPLTMGVVQYGVILSAQHQLDHYAREGGRYAAVHAGEAVFDSSESTDGSLKNYLKDMVSGKGVIPWADISNNITVNPAYGATTPRTSGQPISVTITYNMKKKYFLATFPGIGNMAQTYTATSTFVLE